MMPLGAAPRLLAFALVVTVAAVWSGATYRRFTVRDVPHTRVSVPAESLARFAACMAWSPRTARRVGAGAIYTGPAPRQWDGFNGVQRRGWLWVREGAPFYPVLYHEWVHLAVRGDSAHLGPVWVTAGQCGADVPLFVRFRAEAGR